MSRGCWVSPCDSTHFICQSLPKQGGGAPRSRAARQQEPLRPAFLFASAMHPRFHVRDKRESNGKSLSFSAFPVSRERGRDCSADPRSGKLRISGNPLPTWTVYFPQRSRTEGWTTL